MPDSDQNQRQRSPVGLSYPQVATRLFDTPLLIARPKLDVILGVLAGRMGFEAPAAPADLIQTQMPDRYAMGKAVTGLKRSDAGYWSGHGVAVIPVIGTTVQRGGYVGYSGMTSYDAIEHMLAGALNDTEVSRILLEIDSPGGEVPGVFDLADRIYSARDQKPITAVASELAASAAYLMASACSEIAVARSGYTGSIGVVSAHLDVSSEMDKRGRAVTFVYAGDHKIDGNPYEPLPDRVREAMQADVNRLYGLFTRTVSTYRDRDEQSIVDTQADTFMGTQGVERGLADRVASFNDELDRAMTLARTPATSTAVFFSKQQPTKEHAMSDRNDPPNNDSVDTQAIEARAHAEGVTAGAAAERARIQAIVTHENAEGRTEMAEHLAFETDMSAEAASALLAKSPKQAAQAGGLAAAMQNAGTPGVGDGGGDDAAASAGSGEPVINAADIYARRREMHSPANPHNAH